jgi:hypothetical protein
MIVNLSKVSRQYGCSEEMLSRYRSIEVVRREGSEDKYIINILKPTTRTNVDHIGCTSKNVMKYLVHYAKKYTVPRENITLCEELTNGDS